LSQNRIVRSTKSAARRMIGMVRWAISATPCFGTGPRPEKRLLLIYDFSSQPFSLGDMLIFQEAGLVLCEQYGLSRVDFAAAYDREKPVVEDPAFAHIDAQNFLFHLSSILPAAQTNPLLGSLLLFDSRRMLESYAADNAAKYLIWPSLADYASGEYLFYRAFRELFLPHFHRNGRLPTLHARPIVSAWAKNFLAQIAGNCVSVTVQLRRNPANPARDSIHDAWISFFHSVNGRYPVKFVVLCSPSEIDPRLREIDNVVIAKDFHTSLEQDLALIDAGAAHMGASSGPGTMALFSRKPFCMFGLDTASEAVGGLVHENGRVRYPFSSKSQVWIREKETPEMLIAEFQRIWQQLQPSGELRV
jgi:hypothetical protein